MVWARLLPEELNICLLATCIVELRRVQGIKPGIRVRAMTNQTPMRSTILALIILSGGMTFSRECISGEETVSAEKPVAATEAETAAPVEAPTGILSGEKDEIAEALKNEEALKTAVALNYCRAAFHRIRKNPTEEVLREEEAKILNNLNLTRVEDKEVVSLYSAVLDEISQIGLTETEEDLVSSHHGRSVRRQLTWDALAFGTELATAQFGSAIRTGANSWWDYRSKGYQRDMDLLKLEKSRIAGILKRSNQLLDTFWEMARRKEIPDRWLVRGDDLDHLEEAANQEDAERRLRILQRMKSYMIAYPPYWYYLSRTQQELGQLDEALETYDYLDKIGRDHFRKDDMLATAMANCAAIQDYRGDSSAVLYAQKALNYSPDVWEANLVAARVLQRHGQIAMAEDAILRNLDVGLEEPRSHVFLASLYYFARDEEKLAKLIQDPRVVAHLPAPVLLRCSALVGPDRTPEFVMRSIHASLAAFPQSSFGRDQLTLRVGYAWQLHLASFEVRQGGTKLADPSVQPGNGFYDLRFAENVNWGSPLGSNTPAPEVEIALTYPDTTVVRVQLIGQNRTFGRGAVAVSSPSAMTISSVQVGDDQIAFRMREAYLNDPVTVTTARPVSMESSDGGDAPSFTDDVNYADRNVEEISY
ncbi:hypothetical protein KOR42_34870 [Thalassoglobus neptunius]|uniref:Tetratricopeptide repeat protein n=2 Tax=Thalassoglobus neptunius TaxID=1938619 RepID=A0A5C5WND9_9PLAN|nr:hypothetical protein KOR42_34870 [Thalassoglobus neptunius]